MRTKLQILLDTFEEGITIDAFEIVGGPAEVGVDFMPLIQDNGGDYDSELESKLETTYEELGEIDVIEDCSDAIDDYIVKGIGLKRLEGCIEDALEDVGCTAESMIVTASEEYQFEILQQVTYRYLASQVGIYLTEFFMAYLVKYVLMPMGIEFIDTNIFREFFNSSIYRTNEDEFIGNHNHLIKVFTQFINKKGIK